MSKKFLIVISAVLFVVVSGAAGGYFVFKQRTAVLSNVDQSTGSKFFPTLQKDTDLPSTYQDASGFSFNYPQSLTVKDVTPDTASYYSQLELSRGGQSLKISVADGNINPYKSDSTAKLIGSTVLGGISSSQYLVAGRLVSVAVDQGVLYVVDGPKDGGYWEKVQNDILASFKFGTQTGATAADTNTTYEEEVVQ